MDRGWEGGRHVLTNRSVPRLRFGPPSSGLFFFIPFSSPAETPRLIPRNVFDRCLAALSLPPSTREFSSCVSPPSALPLVSNLFAIPRIDTPADCVFSVSANSSCVFGFLEQSNDPRISRIAMDGIPVVLLN